MFGFYSNLATFIKRKCKLIMKINLVIHGGCGVPTCSGNTYNNMSINKSCKECLKGFMKNCTNFCYLGRNDCKIIENMHNCRLFWGLNYLKKISQTWWPSVGSILQ